MVRLFQRDIFIGRVVKPTRSFFLPREIRQNSSPFFFFRFFWGGNVACPEYFLYQLAFSFCTESTPYVTLSPRAGFFVSSAYNVRIQTNKNSNTPEQLVKCLVRPCSVENNPCLRQNLVCGCRYFQHAHFIPIVGVGKRGEY